MATYIMECGGMERIEQLQMHDNNNIYNKVSNVYRILLPPNVCSSTVWGRHNVEEMKRRFFVVGLDGCVFHRNSEFPENRYQTTGCISASDHVLWPPADIGRKSAGREPLTRKKIASMLSLTLLLRVVLDRKLLRM